MKLNLHLGAAIAVWVVTILIILKELVHPVKTALEAFSNTVTLGLIAHHLVAKVIIMTIIFFLAGYLLRDKHSIKNISDEVISWYSMLGSLAVIFFFYLIHFVLI